MIPIPTTYREFYPELCEIIDYGQRFIEDAAWDAYSQMLDGEEEGAVESLVSQLVNNGHGIPPHLCEWAEGYFLEGDHRVIDKLRSIRGHTD
ncbi:hypothetical protein [Corynebacterium epidermidicanis]|uniref:Uncharacterized protein n=1 Tax=Corynebacterium epidermidicanis TaxID=1050174 RepID=A0A0G3GR58_9CORY|nr:hypothetical protein [Corynebacterium epidermidicanis]AKK03070.1 hypothetical protein CEPID_06045 [Corynebacterium epidermidicanis]